MLQVLAHPSAPPRGSQGEKPGREGSGETGCTQPQGCVHLW